MPSYRQIEQHGEFIDYVTPEQVVTEQGAIKTLYTEYLYEYHGKRYLLDPKEFTVTLQSKK